MKESRPRVETLERVVCTSLCTDRSERKTTGLSTRNALLSSEGCSTLEGLLHFDEELAIAKRNEKCRH